MLSRPRRPRAQPFLDEKTRGKVVLVYTEAEMRATLRCIPPDRLYPVFGGTKEACGSLLERTPVRRPERRSETCLLVTLASPAEEIARACGCPACWCTCGWLS